MTEQTQLPPLDLTLQSLRAHLPGWTVWVKDAKEDDEGRSTRFRLKPPFQCYPFKRKAWDVDKQTPEDRGEAAQQIVSDMAEVQRLWTGYRSAVLAVEGEGLFVAPWEDVPDGEWYEGRNGTPSRIMRRVLRQTSKSSLWLTVAFYETHATVNASLQAPFGLRKQMGEAGVGSIWENCDNAPDFARMTKDIEAIARRALVELDNLYTKLKAEFDALQGKP